MEHLYEILINHGPLGMFVSAFLAGSILPFSSETVMVALLAVGGSPWVLLLMASAGNTLGGISCYYVGRVASPEWLQRKLRIKEVNMRRARMLVNRWGAWMGLFCWVPILGDAILATLGLMRYNPLLTNFIMFVGRTLRYVVVLFSALGVERLFS